MTCDDTERCDTEGCIGGTIYGWCNEPACAGLCEPTGRCTCKCHERNRET